MYTYFHHYCMVLAEIRCAAKIRRRRRLQAQTCYNSKCSSAKVTSTEIEKVVLVKAILTALQMLLWIAPGTLTGGRGGHLTRHHPFYSQVKRDRQCPREFCLLHVIVLSVVTMVVLAPP